MRTTYSGSPAMACHSRAIALFACVFVLAACADTDDRSGAAVDLMPSAPLAAAPVAVPDDDLAPGQVAASAEPPTDAVVAMLTKSAKQNPDIGHTRSPAAVISASIAGHLVAMAFPADMHDPLTDFVVDDRQRLSGVGSSTLDRTDDPLLLWKASGQSGDGTPSLALVGGWAAPAVTTVAIRQDGKWIVAETADVPGAGARGWAVALDDVSWIMTPFDVVAVYDGRGRLLAASPAGFEALPRAAAGLRGGGWRSADIGQRFPADADLAGFPYGPDEPIADRTVTIANYGWVVQFARDEHRVYIGAGPRDLAVAGEVRVDTASTRSHLDADAVVAGTVQRVGDSADVIAAGYAAEHVATVRVVFNDGAWLEVPTRTVAEATPPMSSRVWAARATPESTNAAGVAAYYDAIDRKGNRIVRVSANPSR